WPPWSPNSRSTTLPLPFSSQMKGLSTASDQRIGMNASSAVCVGYCRASDFGTSSPTTIWATVRATSTLSDAPDNADRGSSPRPVVSTSVNGGVNATCAYAPSTRLENVMPTWQAAM